LASFGIAQHLQLSMRRKQNGLRATKAEGRERPEGRVHFASAGRAAGPFKPQVGLGADPTAPGNLLLRLCS
jgi:hypothetical protein